MAEKESNKEPMTMSIWFILFLILLIFSVAYGGMLHQRIADLETQLEEEKNNTSSAQGVRDSILNDIKDLYNKYAEENQVPEVTDNTQVSLGVYTGSTGATEEGTDPTTYTLTLSEGNVAVFSSSNTSGENLIQGSYLVEGTTLTLNSDDALSTYQFTVLEDGNLQYAEANALVTLVRQ